MRMAMVLLLLSGGAWAQLNILNVHDTDAITPGGATPFTPNHVRDAAAVIGANLTVVISRQDFRTAFDGGTWDVVVYSAWTAGRDSGQPAIEDLDRLVIFAAAGGKVVINARNLLDHGLHPFFTNTENFPTVSEDRDYEQPKQDSDQFSSHT